VCEHERECSIVLEEGWKKGRDILTRSEESIIIGAHFRKKEKKEEREQKA